MLCRQFNGKSRAVASRSCAKGPGGFTLIELLVVIAIISLLLSVLLPSLRRAKEAGKRSLCLYNTRGLTTAWVLYIEENDGRLPTGCITVNEGWILAIQGFELNPEQAPVELQLKAMEDGQLFPYLDTTKVFRCPVAKPDELRTYSTTHALNGHPNTAAFGGEVLLKFAQIKNTGGRISFQDDFIRNWDGCWMIYNDRPEWWNTTPIRHGSGGNVFSFADGHSDFWSWDDQRTIALAERCYEDDTPEARNYYPDNEHPGNPDLVRMQMGVWGKLGY